MPGNMTRTVIAVVDDLFFASKIRGTAEQLGVSVNFPRSKDAVVEAARGGQASLIIVDLHSHKIDAIQLARQLKASAELSSIPLVGFFSHVQNELQAEAESAGFDRVLPRSAFARNLSEILTGPG